MLIEKHACGSPVDIRSVDPWRREPSFCHYSNKICKKITSIFEMVDIKGEPVFNAIDNLVDLSHEIITSALGCL